jgi:hypothetical protein
MAIHFDPYLDVDWEASNSEFHPCGSRIADSKYHELYCAQNWDKVTCKKCLKNKKALQESFEKTEKQICEDMGSMAAFIKKEKL